MNVSQLNKKKVNINKLNQIKKLIKKKKSKNKSGLTRQIMLTC
jgi:hypothetical protein